MPHLRCWVLLFERNCTSEGPRPLAWVVRRKSKRDPSSQMALARDDNEKLKADSEATARAKAKATATAQAKAPTLPEAGRMGHPESQIQSQSQIRIQIRKPANRSYKGNMSYTGAEVARWGGCL